MQPATPDDTLAIYALLHDVRYHGLPEYGKAKPIIEGAHSYVVRESEKVTIWAAYHWKEREVHLDVVISPTLSKHKITKGVCKHLLATGFNLSHNEPIVIGAYTAKGIKAAITLGFHIDEKADEDGWTRLVLTYEMYKRKFGVRE